MPALAYDVIDNWAEGVQTSQEPDRIPKNASPHGKNAELISIGPGEAVVQKRKGMRTMNSTPITGSPVIIGQHEFKRLSGGSFTAHHLLVSDGGRLDKIDTSGTLSTVDATFATSGTYFPEFADANNLCFIANGQDANQKFDGTNVTPMGITRPTVGTMAAADGGAGNHNGTYELRVTFYNSATGHESSASDTAAATVNVTNRDLDWTNIPVSSDTQVTARRLYIRNTSTMSEFFLAGTVSDNTATTATTNVTDASLVDLGPDTEENDPPVTTNFLVWHNSRMFAAGNSTNPSRLFYSKIGLPEAFDPDAFERISEDDGQKITALHKANEILVIFKSDSIYGLFGDDPATWEIRLISKDVGCTSHRSVVTLDNLTYFWSERGPMVWDGIGAPQPIGQQLVAETIAPDQINHDELDRVAAAPDRQNQRILFAYPTTNQTRLTSILSFNTKLGRFEGTWDPMDVGSFGVADDSNGRPWVFLGNNAGQVFRVGELHNDGIRTGTSSGTFVAAATSVSTITDGTATFDTTGGSLIERKVTLLKSTGEKVGTTRPRITSNTATALTLASAINGLTVGATYTYLVGGPDWEWDILWNDQATPFHKKRYEFLYVQASGTTSSVVMRVDVDYNADSATRALKSLTFASTGGGIWGTGLWGSMLWGGAGTFLPKRLRLAQVGWIMKARFRNHYPNQAITLHKVGLRSGIRGIRLS